MKLKELKYKIGSQAENIIASGLGLQKKGNKYLGQCPRGGHTKSNPQYEWKKDHFFCYDCKTSYDIVDYFREHNQDNWHNELCNLAGIKTKPKQISFKPVAPITKAQSKLGMEYLYKRGISQEILDLYRVRADNEWIYFNYATPDNKLIATKWRGINEKKFNATQNGNSILYGLHLFKAQKNLIICEGEIDALSLAEIGKGSDKYLFSSLPQGAGSLPKVIENCKQWIDMFDAIIIIPDQDKAGMEFKEQASELLSDYNLFCIDLPCNDVNEYMLDGNFKNEDIFKYCQPVLPQLLAIDTYDVDTEEELFHFKSGFPTIDYNWDGLQGEWLTLISGKRGGGKTLMAKQILIASAMQGIKSYYFTGEEKIAKEKGKMAMIGYGKKGASIQRSGTINGAKRFTASKDAIEKYNKEFAPFIKTIDFTMAGSNIFEKILPDMNKAIRYGVKLFVLDNLMILTNGTNDVTKKERDRQIYIIRELKKFVNINNVHLILIVHPNKGGEDISGATEIQNLADGIMTLNRFNNIGESEVESKALDNLRSRFNGKDVSSLLRFSKGRDDGTFIEMGLVFEGETGRLLDASPEMDRDNYHRDGYYAVPRYTDEDVPNYDDQYSSK